MTGHYPVAVLAAVLGATKVAIGPLPGELYLFLARGPLFLIHLFSIWLEVQISPFLIIMWIGNLHMCSLNWVETAVQVVGIALSLSSLNVETAVSCMWIIHYHRLVLIGYRNSFRLYHKVCQAEETLARRMRQVPSMVYEHEINEQTGKATFPWASKASSEIFGLSPADMHDAERVMKMIHPEDLPSFHASIGRSREDMSEWRWQGRVTTDGETKTISCGSVPERRSRHVLRWTGSMQDTTELESLRASEKLPDVLRGVYSLMPGTIAFEVENPGPDGTHLWVVGAIEALLGYTHEEWLACNPFNTVLTPEGREEAHKFIKCLLKPDHNRNTMFEIRMRHRDGATDVWLRTDRTSRKIHEDGTNLLVVLHDITAEVRLREERQRRVVAEAMAARFKSACAYLSHEIRNQIYPQSVSLDMMRRSVLSDSVRVADTVRSIDMILGANKTVSAILNNVLDLAKWENGDFPVRKTLFPLERLLRAVALYAECKGAAVSGHDVDPSWYVEADEHVLKQALTNLVSNALKFSRDTPVTVRFAFNPSANRLVATVSDEGQGLDQKSLAKVMMPFAQVRTGNDNVAQGTGLGLPLAAAMVEKGHGGKLTLASEGLGRGATATVDVVLRMVVLDDEGPESAEDETLEWVRYDPLAAVDVLVVDDSSVNRTVASCMCQHLGLTCEEAESGAAAVSAMDAGKSFSLVLMDMQMPGQNGDAAAEQARDAGYRGVVALLSGDTFKPHEKKEMKRRCGFAAILTKTDTPSTPHVLRRLHELKTGSS